MSSLTHQILAVGAMAFAVVAAVVAQHDGTSVAAGVTGGADRAVAVESGADHLSTAELAERISNDPASLVLVDVRPSDEFAAFHLPGAWNLSLPELLGAPGRALLDGSRDKLVVLYSNGMTHPGQAWIELARLGYSNVRLLEDGLDGFVEQQLMPASLAGPGASGSGAARAALRARVLDEGARR